MRSGAGPMTEPYIPPDCDLRDFPRMMIDIPRLRASPFDATQDDGAWRAALNLWMSSWHGDPAASLEDEEGALCKAAGLGRDLRTWRKVKAVALRGWTLCDDGRLYHATVAEFALEAWLEKLQQRLSSGAGNRKRWGVPFDPAPVEAAIRDAVARLIQLNPQSKAIAKTLRRGAKKDVPDASPPDPDAIPPGRHRDRRSVPSGSQETGTGTGTLSTDADASVDHAQPKASPRGSRLPDDWQPSSEDIGFAEREGFGPADTAREAERFRDFWHGKAGVAGRKADWPATWRNWIRRAAESRPRPSNDLFQPGVTRPLNGQGHEPDPSRPTRQFADRSAKFQRMQRGALASLDDD